MNTFRNVLKLIGLTLLLTLTVLGLGMLANAQAPVPAPVIAFNLPNGATLYRTQYEVPVIVNAAYPGGLKGFTLSGAYSTSRIFNLSGATRAQVKLYFYVGYYPVGDYPFTATATGLDGHTSTQSILVHVK